MGLFASPSSTPSPHDELLQWLSLEPPLPVQLSLIPSICRFVAFLLFLPVILLAFTDLIGWAIFKLVLRPLGYASTTRFKDPEPSDGIKTSSRRSRSSSRPRAPSRPRIRPVDSDFIDATIDRSHSPAVEGDESSDATPTDESRSPSRSPQMHSLSLDDRSTSSSSLDTSRMNRYRAPSVGFDGPLFAVGEELASPGRSDDEPLPELDDGAVTIGGASDGSDSEGGGVGGLRKRSRGGPRRGPSFGFTALGAEARND